MVTSGAQGAAVFLGAILTDNWYPEGALGLNAAVSERAMVDHLAWAAGYRNRAAKCQLSAKNTSSVKFGNCYRLLSQYYIQLASLEENFERKQIDSLSDEEMIPANELPLPVFAGESERSRLAIVPLAD
jgi:hypothetical protein